MDDRRLWRPRRHARTAGGEIARSDDRGPARLDAGHLISQPVAVGRGGRGMDGGLEKELTRVQAAAPSGDTTSTRLVRTIGPFCPRKYRIVRTIRPIRTRRPRRNVTTARAPTFTMPPVEAPPTMPPDKLRLGLILPTSPSTDLSPAEVLARA